MIIVQYPQQVDAQMLRKQILQLENSVWGTGDPKLDNCFPTQPDTYVTSLLLMEEEQVLCHIVIRRQQLFHKDCRYLVYGLSEVVTHPGFRGQGLGTTLIRKASLFIEKQGADLSIFTCKPSLVPFYSQGGWAAVPGACLVGGTKEQPFRSDRLGLKTMIQFYSPHAKKHKKDFEKSDIFLELSPQQLW